MQWRGRWQNRRGRVESVPQRDKSRRQVRRSDGGSRVGRIVEREGAVWRCCRGIGSSKANGERKKLPPGQSLGEEPPLLDCLRPFWPEHHFWADEVGLSWAGGTDAPRLAVGLTGGLQVD